MQYWSQLLYFQLVEVDTISRRMVILACLIHHLAFMSLAKLEVNLILEEAKPKLCLWVLVIFANAGRARLV